MSQYPAGAWELDDLDDFATWMSALMPVTPSAFRPVLIALVELSIRLAAMSDTSQYEDPEDEDAPPASGGPPDTSKGPTIMVKSRSFSPTAFRGQEELMNDPTVCLHDPTASLLIGCCA